MKFLGEYYYPVLNGVIKSVNLFLGQVEVIVYKRNRLSISKNPVVYCLLVDLHHLALVLGEHGEVRSLVNELDHLGKTHNPSLTDN